MNKVSIITINYNNSEGLDKTLKSIYNQTHTNFEHIVIDGGSTDSSRAVIENYKDKIAYWVSEKDKGIYNAMNKGVLKATCDYVLFLNSGDTFNSNEALKNAVSYTFNTDLVSFKINFIGENSTRIVSPPKRMSFYFMHTNTLPQPSTFIKRTLFNEVGLYDETLKVASDWKFFILALFKYDCTYKAQDDVLVNFYLDGISSSKTIPGEADKVLEDNFKGFLDDYKELIEFKRLASSYTYKLFIKLRKYHFFNKICSLIYKVFYRNKV